MWCGDIGFRGDMTLQFTTRRRGQTFNNGVTIWVPIAYRKLVSTERRAFVILLQRPGSAVLRTL